MLSQWKFKAILNSFLSPWAQASTKPFREAKRAKIEEGRSSMTPAKQALLSQFNLAVKEAETALKASRG